MTRGRLTEKSRAAFVAASVAARIIATPPAAWTFSMNTPRRVASRTAPATVFGMSWYFRSRKTRQPRLCACSTAAGPAAVKSWLPIFTPGAAPTSRLVASASRSRRASASASVSTSRATNSRAAGSEPSVILLQAPHALFPFEQGLDGPDGGLDAVHGEVVRDVLRERGAPERGGVLPGAAVLRRVDHEGDLAALHEIHGIRTIPLGHLVDDVGVHAVTLQHPRRAGGRDQR